MSSLRAQSLKEILTFTRASTAWYYDIDGAYTEAQIDEPRIEYDPITGTARGLLIEEARTNLILDSATFADQEVTVSAQAYTLSFYGTGSIAISGSSPEHTLAGTGANDRVSLTFTPAYGSPNFPLTLTATGTVTNAQLEAGAFVTSYIPTTSAAVTRAADVCYTSALSPWFNEDTGTVFVEYLVPWTNLTTSTGYHRVVQIDDGASDNRHIPAYFHNGVRYGDTFVSASSEAIFDMSALTGGIVQKQAYAWSANDVASAANGGTLQTDASATMPTGLTAFRLGAPESSSLYIRKVKFYPRRLTNAELAALVA